MKRYCIRYTRGGIDGEGVYMFFIYAKTEQEAIKYFVMAGNIRQCIISISEVGEVSKWD